MKHIKLDTLIHNLPGIVYRSKNDENFTVEFMSEGCFALTGYKSEEFVNGNVLFPHLIFKEDNKAIAEDVQKAIANKIAFFVEYRITHKNGTIKYCREKGQGIFDVNGNLIALEGFVQDITKQKETELQLQEEKAKNRALLEAIPDMMFIQDLEGNYTDCFAPKLEKFSMPVKTLIGENMNNILPPHVYKVIKKAHKLAIKSGALQVVEYHVKNKNKEDFFEARVIHLNHHGILTIVRDITEKKAAELKIIKNEARISALLETLPDVIIVYDKYGNLIELHAPDNYQFSVPYNEHIGKNIDAILPKDICEIIRHGFSDCEKTKKPKTVEYSLIINNKLTHVESRIIKTSEGNFLTIIRDVTQRKSTEIELKENEERLRLALEAGEFGSWDWNLLTNRIIRDENEHLLFGANFKNQAPTFESFMAMVHADDKVRIKLAISKVLKIDSTYTNEYRIVLPDKSIRWLKAKGKVYKSINGKPIRMLGITHDITAQKRAEQKFKESEDKLRNYTEELEREITERTKELTTTVQKLIESNLSLEDQILVTKAAENKIIQSKFLLDNISKNFPKGFVVVCDSNFNILLVEGEEVDELGFRGLANEKTLIDNVIGVPQSVKIKVKENVLKTFKGKHCSFEVGYQNRVFLINSSPLRDQNNNITQVLLVHHNITKQKQIELNIQNSLKQEKELSELKSRFISMASHEFRTPLSAILSSAILIEKLNAPGKEDKRLNHVSKIRSNIKNLVIILNDFLSLSKLNEGKVIAQPSTFNIIDFSKSVIEEMEGVKKRGQIILFKHQQENLEVFLDFKLMRHIIFNLISNAIKYSEENKEITYKIASNNKQLFITVADKGIGIPKEDLDNMFRRFYRANNTTNIQGTGLGLNITKQYTELMGGKIAFKSELNVGTTFYLEFPLNIE
ncbi:PAS domain-containing sensor histidine kinase [Polaribacter sp. Q13]|uniref:PAS domain-containing sensor histidine kinase n=1 Tax=Polaribacter sp. Q13 TaxID=2806551 RepID=UPI00193C33EA|nr:PAS domain-containing sensor histidine kinase [Polaribacter sp. Q13]QVY65563.1 PAS domain S-box protein [Polaribacter sp. Q13]